MFSYPTAALKTLMKCSNEGCLHGMRSTSRLKSTEAGGACISIPGQMRIIDTNGDIKKKNKDFIDKSL